MRRKDKIKRKRNSLTKELGTIDIYINGIENHIIKKRIEHILEWYIRKSTFYKNLFYWLSLLVILINAAIPIMNQMKFIYYENIVSIISAFASVFTSCITLFTTKDTWFRYRKSVELIKKECMLFSSKDEYYQDENRETLLIKNVENIISSERQSWEKVKFDKSISKK